MVEILFYHEMSVFEMLSHFAINIDNSSFYKHRHMSKFSFTVIKATFMNDPYNFRHPALNIVLRKSYVHTLFVHLAIEEEQREREKEKIKPGVTGIELGYWS